MVVRAPRPRGARPVHAGKPRLQRQSRGTGGRGLGKRARVVTKRDDGLYAFVAIESHFEVVLDPSPDWDAVRDLVARAEKGCFVGNSLTARPTYRWTVNGERVT